VNETAGESAFPPVVDNPRLQGKPAKKRRRKRRPKTDEQFAAEVVAPMIRALGRRVAHRDPEDFAAMFGVIEAAQMEAKVEALKGMRARSHCTWAEIGEATGVSHQAARQFWTKRGVT
jgi:hypothetical protein